MRWHLAVFKCHCLHCALHISQSQFRYVKREFLPCLDQIQILLMAENAHLNTEGNSVTITVVSWGLILKQSRIFPDSLHVSGSPSPYSASWAGASGGARVTCLHTSFQISNREMNVYPLAGSIVGYKIFYTQIETSPQAEQPKPSKCRPDLPFQKKAFCFCPKICFPRMCCIPWLSPSQSKLLHRYKVFP